MKPNIRLVQEFDGGNTKTMIALEDGAELRMTIEEAATLASRLTHHVKEYVNRVEMPRFKDEAKETVDEFLQPF